jgi:hypothetical protein
MLSNSTRALAVVLLCTWSAFAGATSICPAKPGNPLRYVDVFDGLPEEQATLVPDQAGARAGYWDLGYVFDAGRAVTVRCRYRNGTSLDVTIQKKVNRCNYRINRAKTLFLNCK